MPVRASTDEEYEYLAKGEEITNSKQKHALEVGRERLLELERNIERRYLKPPLNKA